MTHSTNTIIVPAYNSKSDEFVALQISGKSAKDVTKEFEKDCEIFGRSGSLKLWYCHEHNDLISGTSSKKGMDYKGRRASPSCFVDPKIVEMIAKEHKVELPKKLVSILNNVQVLMAKKDTKSAKETTKAKSKTNQNPTPIVETKVEVAKS